MQPQYSDRIEVPLAPHLSVLSLHRAGSEHVWFFLAQTQLLHGEQTYLLETQLRHVQLRVLHYSWPTGEYDAEDQVIAVIYLGQIK
jgi:hypothetical protein